MISILLFLQISIDRTQRTFKLQGIGHIPHVIHTDF